MLNFGKELVKIAKVYYITGNHERRLENFESIMQELSDIGFIVLLNRVSVFNDKGFDVSILGLDENQADFDDYKARKNGTFVYKDMSPYFAELEKTVDLKLYSHISRKILKM